MTRESELLRDMWDVLRRECHRVVTEENYIAINTAIEKLEQEPKTGHWIHLTTGDVCSECRWSTGKYTSPSKHCPNCGARMIHPEETEKIGCKTTICENCTNHKYCDFEPQ